jgi:hypothetical protein
MNQKSQCDCQCGCGTSSEKTSDTKKILIIAWQRLVAEGNTCPRCGSTEDELDKAVDQLKEKLKSLDIDVVLEKAELSIDEFKKDPVKSNSILFNGISLENIINAKTGKSQCCDVCGDEECRTVEIKGETFETIPAEIIVRAGLKVAADL